VKANAYGVPGLSPEQRVTLNPGRPVPGGAIAVVSPGTGLGEATLVQVDGTPVAMPSEGGHAEFGPLNALEWALVRYVRRELRCVSYELLASGPGLVRMHGLLRERTGMAPPPWLAARLADGGGAAAIGEAGVAGSDPVCRQAVDLWVAVLAAEAANAAVKFLAVGGVYIGGGIAPKLLDRLNEPLFMERFAAKDKLSGLLRDVPVHVILDEGTALRGALARALTLARAP
jgi:glucokinase